jgi:hypothetical protein
VTERKEQLCVRNAAKGANPVIRTSKIDKFRQELVDFSLLFIKNIKIIKKLAVPC